MEDGRLDQERAATKNNMKSSASSAPNIATIEKQVSVTSDKPSRDSVSPSNSPRTSPKPSPRPQTKRDHSKSTSEAQTIKKEHKSSDSLLNVNYGTKEGSPSSQDSNTSRNSNTSNPDQNDSSKDSVSLRDKKDASGNRSKKKSWFNSLYPTYKSRSTDFKKLFGEVVASEERLVVDYSCALQKEILQHGRLYVTQNYLCFYANILGWETNLCLRWRDVAAITKEKTALIIPNAVLISTKAEKFFFTSFAQRDKTYMMLFRVWQNALMDQQMSPQEMWQWVHQCYGAELGLTSEDEDYIPPVLADDEKSSRLSAAESFSDTEEPAPIDSIMEHTSADERIDGASLDKMSRHHQPSQNSGTLQTEHTDHSDSDSDKPITMKDNLDIKCTNSHEGRVLLQEEFSIPVDQLFTLLFTSSKFYLDFHASRKTTDLTQTPWTINPLDNSKSRVVNMTYALGQAVGPKTSQVTEQQTMLPCSEPGHLYAIDVESSNAGIPYADSFYVMMHYCLKKVSETHTSLSVHVQIKYRKSVWGLVKGMIERNVWSGMGEFYMKLKEALHAEGEEMVPEKRRKSRKKRRLHSLPKYSLDVVMNNVTRKKSQPNGVFSTGICTTIVFIVLLILLVINVLLYYKLWHLEELPTYSFVDTQSLKNLPDTHEKWINLLQKQEKIHVSEAQKWQKILKSATELLRQAEDQLNELHGSIQFSFMNKMMEQTGSTGDSKGGSSTSSSSNSNVKAEL